MDTIHSKSQKQEEFEYCIVCEEKTNVKKSENIVFRSGYIEGAGQLCFKCHQTRKMHKTGSYETSEWTRYGK